MKNTERKDFRSLVGTDLVACTKHRIEKGGVRGLLDLTFRNSSARLAKNRYKVSDTEVQSVLCTA